jgi:hypothetical protein
LPGIRHTWQESFNAAAGLAFGSSARAAAGRIAIVERTVVPAAMAAPVVSNSRRVILMGGSRGKE